VIATIPSTATRTVTHKHSRIACRRRNRIERLFGHLKNWRRVTTRYDRLACNSPWHDLSDVFGDWNSVFRRFSRWSRKGMWGRIFETMLDDTDFKYLIVDSTIVRAHQHAAGAKKAGPDGQAPPNQALGRSRGSRSTKIHFADRRLGCPGAWLSRPDRRATHLRPKR
jgi:transposase